MRKVVLFIAMSLDGYIADKQGGVDWLCGQDREAETADTYSAFVREVDTVVMGWRTYHQIVTELSPGAWVYGDLASYVITHRSVPPREGVVFTGESPCAVVRKLKGKPGKNIWICGGADIIRQLMREDLIDEYDISVIPTVLGSGIRLFDTLPEEIRLRLRRVDSSNGIVELAYMRREEKKVSSGPCKTRPEGV